MSDHPDDPALDGPHDPLDDEDGTRAESSAGCAWVVAGAAAASAVALPRAAYSIEGGFESYARDWSVILFELPLILLAGFALPPLIWTAARRRLPGWAAGLVCAAALALGLWGLTLVWHPRQAPDPGYGPGI
ncbi:hypothetical protein [Streptomyces sp. NPDC058855]|uniref:hypothetical protein n=1 Tax=Streptomyces sp. NPDC058855 TaxID=3346651 RepID=UPI00369660A6